jgi:hypothetical protein
MKLTTKQAALLSVRERQLIESKGPWQVKQLAGLIRRTRELRDKQQQQIQRQTITAVRGGTRGIGEQSARSQEKAQLFDRALHYFEAELHQLNTESTAAARELGVGKMPAREASTSKTRGNGHGKAAGPARVAANKTNGPIVAPVSNKARIAVPRNLAGRARSQVASLPPRSTRASKSRAGSG